jgi:glycosyltransferase involved in cell wall biosynthesis
MLKLNEHMQVDFKTKTILSVGRFFLSGHCKNQLQIAKAYKNIFNSDKKYAEWELILIGSINIDSKKDIDYINNINEILKDTKGKVILNANRQELEYNYKKSFIYVHATGLNTPINEPERHEHFGITPIEAMSYGCIPLVYHIGGPAETLNKLNVGYKFTSEKNLESNLIKIMDTYKLNDYKENLDIFEKTWNFLSENRLENNLQRILKQK